MKGLVLFSSNEVINENVQIQEEFQSENSESIEEQETSNGLENFHIDEDDTPHLFNSEDSVSTEKEFESFSKSESDDEDDLEIPAFLRRQKN